MSPLALPILSTIAALLVGVAGSKAIRSSRSAVARARIEGPIVVGPPPWFSDVLASLDLPVAPEAAWAWAERGAALAVLVLVVRAPLVVVVGVAGAVGASVARRARARQAERLELDRALPTLLDDVVAAMASGSSLLQGLAAASTRAGPLGRELDVVLRTQAHGLGLQPALDAWADRHPTSGLGLVADALALAGSTGGSQVAALHSVGDTLRERDAGRREVRAMAAQAQLSALVLVVTPVAFALVVALLDHRIARFLFAHPLGWVCLVGGMAMDAAGAWWMRRLVRSVS